MRPPAKSAAKAKKKAAVAKPAKKKSLPSKKFKTVDEYIGELPASTQKIVKKLRKTIRQAVPDAEEMISYNMPTFKLNGFLVSYAVWKDHLGLYPKTKAMTAAIKELANYEGAKATVKFPLDKPFPFELVRRIAKFRERELREKL